MDEFDRAQEIDLQAAADALEVQRIKAARQPKLQPAGECLNPACCEEFAPKETTRLFCGPKCAAEHQKFAAIQPQTQKEI